MKASEAKKLSLDSTKDSQLPKIYKEIKEAAQRGEVSIWWYDDINDRVRAALKEDGYKVGKTQFDRNETLTQISWE